MALVTVLKEDDKGYHIAFAYSGHVLNLSTEYEEFSGFVYSVGGDTPRYALDELQEVIQADIAKLLKLERLTKEAIEKLKEKENNGT